MINDLNIYIYDFEVLRYDWLVVFKEFKTGKYTIIYNDNKAVVEFLNRTKPILTGFNVKHYDSHILKGVQLNLTPEELKEINDYIFGGYNGWDLPMLQGYAPRVPFFDLMDDTQVGVSLKSFEGHSNMNIQESSVDFNLDHKCSEEEMAELIEYCIHDVDATEELLKCRMDYLNTKIVLGMSKGYTAEQSLYWTNAKLTSVYLDAKKPTRMWNDEREYVYPDKLLKEYIPQEVFAFFNKMYDKSIDRDDVFSSKLDIIVGGCPCTIAYGGIHGAIPTYVEEETETRTIRNKDVASYYPHLMTLPLSEGKEWGFCSRAIPDAQIFSNALEERVQAKRNGDNAKNQALKLVLNTTYGCMGNGKYINGEYIAHNDLYDPLMCRSVCITGQLFLLELTEHLLQECPSLKVIQLNTDGIMVSLDLVDEPKYQEITKEWETRTGFELEEDFIHKIIQKDVNNYIEIPINEGKPKVKGGLLVRGMSKAGAFNINNNAVVIADAIKNYFIKGISPRDTIYNCNNIFDFQYIAKASHKYSRVYKLLYDVEKIEGLDINQRKDAVEIPAQMCNRVYASKDTRYGTLYKIKGDTGGVSKMSGLPDSCLIDNRNEATLDQVDREWYVIQAEKYINDFLGIKPKKVNGRKLSSLKRSVNKILRRNCSMEQPSKTPSKVAAKLTLARNKFLEANVGKSGKNLHLEFKYFELEDIVPQAERIFKEVGLCHMINMNETTASMVIYDIDDMEAGYMTFSVPFREPEANKVNNKMQALGQAVTYLRRYLYMLVLDIVEHDDIEPTLTAETEEKKPAKKKAAKPATKEERKEIKEELVEENTNASEAEMEVLKNLAQAVYKKDQEANQEMINQIAIKTKAFKECDKKVCGQLTERLQQMLDEYEA